MVEVRCGGCGRMLGTFEGRGEVKCPKTECGGMNIFNTSENCYQFTPKSRMVKNQQSGKERN
nr:hypothetical protein [uncultured Eisenbergiella sp.]